MKSSTNRILWIDVAKGIAIILMVLGHSSLPEGVQNWIFAFHMPLFFLLSGLTTNWDKDDLCQFSRKKIVSLGLPFFWYSLVCLSIIWAGRLATLTWGRGWGDFALWFVPVLFVALIATKFITKNNGWLKIVFIIGLPILSAVLSYYHIALPWSLSVAPLAAFFILMGLFAKRHIYSYVNNKWWYIAFAFILTLAISHFWHLDMAHNQCLPLIPLVVGALAGTAFTCSVSQVIDRYSKWLAKVLQTVGRETFVILAFSQVIIMTLNKYFTFFPLLKYIMFIIALIVITYFKKILVNHYHLLINNDR